MRAQSQTVCREIERKENSVRLKFIGCAVVGEAKRKSEDVKRRTVAGGGFIL